MAILRTGGTMGVDPYGSAPLAVTDAGYGGTGVDVAALLGPTLAELQRIRKRLRGNPGALRAAARQLRDAALAAPAYEGQTGVWTGDAMARFNDTMSTMDAAGQRIASGALLTAADLNGAAEALVRAHATLDRIIHTFVVEATAAVAAATSTPLLGPEVAQAQAQAAIAPYAANALAEAEAAVADAEAALAQVNTGLTDTTNVLAEIFRPTPYGQQMWDKLSSGQNPFEFKPSVLGYAALATVASSFPTDVGRLGLGQALGLVPLRFTNDVLGQTLLSGGQVLENPAADLAARIGLTLGVNGASQSGMLGLKWLTNGKIDWTLAPGDGPLVSNIVTTVLALDTTKRVLQSNGIAPAPADQPYANGSRFRTNEGWLFEHGWNAVNLGVGVGGPIWQHELSKAMATGLPFSQANALALSKSWRGFVLPAALLLATAPLNDSIPQPGRLLGAPSIEECVPQLQSPVQDLATILSCTAKADSTPAAPSPGVVSIQPEESGIRVLPYVSETLPDGQPRSIEFDPEKYHEAMSRGQLETEAMYLGGLTGALATGLWVAPSVGAGGTVPIGGGLVGSGTGGALLVP